MYWQNCGCFSDISQVIKTSCQLEVFFSERLFEMEDVEEMQFSLFGVEILYFSMKETKS